MLALVPKCFYCPPDPGTKNTRQIPFQTTAAQAGKRARGTSPHGNSGLSRTLHCVAAAAPRMCRPDNPRPSRARRTKPVQNHTLPFDGISIRSQAGRLCFALSIRRRSPSGPHRCRTALRRHFAVRRCGQLRDQKHYAHIIPAPLVCPSHQNESPHVARQDHTPCPCRVSMVPKGKFFRCWWFVRYARCRLSCVRSS